MYYPILPDMLPDDGAKFVPELPPDGAHRLREVVIFNEYGKLRFPLQVDECDFVAVND